MNDLWRFFYQLITVNVNDYTTYAHIQYIQQIRSKASHLLLKKININMWCAKIEQTPYAIIYGFQMLWVSIMYINKKHFFSRWLTIKIWFSYFVSKSSFHSKKKKKKKTETRSGMCYSCRMCRYTLWFPYGNGYQAFISKITVVVNYWFTLFFSYIYDIFGWYLLFPPFFFFVFFVCVVFLAGKWCIWAIIL